MYSVPAFRSMAILCCVCWALFALIAVAVTCGWTQSPDMAAVLAFRGENPAFVRYPGSLLRWVQSVTLLGDGTVRLSIVSGVALGLAAQKQLKAAAFLIVTAFSAGLINDLMKAAFARPRPLVELENFMTPAGWSFPSGHSMGAMTAWLAIALAIQPVLPNTAARRAAIGTAVGIAGLVALSRVMLGVHYPSDVTAGLIAGTGWVLAMRLAFQPLSSPAP